MTKPFRILVAGVGNVLKADDGFGVRAIEAFGRLRPIRGRFYLSAYPCQADVSL